MSRYEVVARHEVDGEGYCTEVCRDTRGAGSKLRWKFEGFVPEGTVVLVLEPNPRSK